MSGKSPGEKSLKEGSRLLVTQLYRPCVGYEGIRRVPHQCVGLKAGELRCQADATAAQRCRTTQNYPERSECASLHRSAGCDCASEMGPCYSSGAPGSSKTVDQD